MNSRAKVYQFNTFEHGTSQRYLVDNINSDSIVLDVGCACGDFGRILTKEKNNIKIFGMEYNKDSIKIAERTKAYKQIHQIDLNNFNENAFKKYFYKFDYIVFGDVLEHILYPELILQKFKSFLKPGGYFLISFPNSAHASVKAELLMDNLEFTDVGLLDKTHIKFWTYRGIAKMISDNGFKIERLDKTAFRFQGCQSINNFERLPKNIQSFIKNDKHSHVCQYIVKLSLFDNDIYQHNINILNNWILPKESFFKKTIKFIYNKKITSKKIKIMIFGINVFSKRK